MKGLSNDGFTVVELLISISVTTILMIAVSTLLLRNIQATTLDTTRAALLQQIEQTLDEVNIDIRISANADTNNRNADPNSPGGSSNPYGWTSNSTTLVLATAATTTSGTIIFSDPANYITTKNNIVYYLSNGTLYRRMIAANVTGNSAKTTCPPANATASCPADKALLSKVTNFTVTYLNGDSSVVNATDARAVQLSVTASSTQYQSTQSVNYTTRMVFRND